MRLKRAPAPVAKRHWVMSTALVFFYAFIAIVSSNDAAVSRDAVPQEKPLEPRPNGDGLAFLLKKIAKEGLLTDPVKLAAALDMEVNVATKIADIGHTPCSEGGRTRQTTVTHATFGESWYRPTPEGVRDMKVPQFLSDRVYIAGNPKLFYDLYRTSLCNGANEEIDASLTFGDVSAYSCFTPERLRRLIGTTYHMQHHGIAGSSYLAPPRVDDGATLVFTFQMGAPCAIGVTVRQNTRDGLRYQRAFMKWRTCYDQARLDYCTANPGADGDSEKRMNEHGEAIYGRGWDAYLDREPFTDEPAPPYKIVEDPCSAGR